MYFNKEYLKCCHLFLVLILSNLGYEVWATNINTTPLRGLNTENFLWTHPIKGQWYKPFSSLPVLPVSREGSGPDCLKTTPMDSLQKLNLVLGRS